MAAEFCAAEPNRASRLPAETAGPVGTKAMRTTPLTLGVRRPVYQPQPAEMDTSDELSPRPHRRPSQDRVFAIRCPLPTPDRVSGSGRVEPAVSFGSMTWTAETKLPFRTNHSRCAARVRCRYEAMRRLSPGCKVRYGGSPSMVEYQRPGPEPFSWSKSHQVSRHTCAQRDTPRLDFRTWALMAPNPNRGRANSRSTPLPSLARLGRTRAMAIGSNSSSSWP